MGLGRTRTTTRTGLGRRLVIGLTIAALALAACGGDDDDDATTDDTGDATTDTSGGTGELTDLGHGVTADTIKVGIAIIDYAAIADFVDFSRGDQQATAQVFVDYINENGGVGGRMIEPVYKSYPPIPGMEPSPLALCTAWTEDDEVFAVLGVFIDFSGDGQLCVSRDHETVHIGHELEQVWIEQAPGGLMLTPDTTKEVAAQNLINLMAEEGSLDGRTVGVLADQDAEGRVNDIIVPGLEDAGVELGSTAQLTITDEDTAQAQAQLDAFIERWRSEDVNAIFMAGLLVSDNQFVEKVKAALPDALLITDSSSTAQQAQDMVAAGVNPNPYEGMLGVEGPSASEAWANKNELYQTCVDVYEEATGTTVIGPDDLTPNAQGKTEEIYVAVRDFCGELTMFKTIAEKVGPELTTENWQAAVDEFGSIDLVTTDIASLCEGKYAADDAFRLVEFDSSIGEQGDWSGITEVEDASGGVCS
jgi:ABC-type branched-subunit amino acid transport system substrate-binding protein